MRILFERQLPCSPEAAFGLFSVPEQINRWSFGTVRTLALGDGDHPGGVGALREIQFPGWPGRFQEVVEIAKPPGRYAWRTVAHGPIQKHETEVHLSYGPSGTHLRFRLELEFAHQTLAQVARFRLEPGLRESLNKMVALAQEAATLNLPPVRRVDAGADVNQLLTDARESLTEQRALIERLEAEKNPLRWLAWVHAEATELQIAACQRSQFQHAAWVLRLVPRFHRYHLFSLDRARRGGRTEPQWAAAFDAVSQPQRLLEALELALQAHIEADLPRALAETYVTSYQSQCDYARLRGDFITMGEVLAEVGPRIFRTVEQHALPTGPRFARQVLPSRIFERAFGRRFRALLGTREKAFEEGRELARILNGGQGVNTHQMFAACALGTEDALISDLKRLDIACHKERGGVSFSATLRGSLPCMPMVTGGLPRDRRPRRWRDRGCRPAVRTRRFGAMGRALSIEQYVRRHGGRQTCRLSEHPLRGAALQRCHCRSL